MSSDHGSRLRDLIEKWRVKAHKSTSDPRANTYEQCADELDALLRASASAPPEKETAAAYSERVQRLRSGVYIRTGEQLSERVLAAILAYQASLTPVASASALSPEPALRCASTWATFNRCVRPVGHAELHLTSDGFVWPLVVTETVALNPSSSHGHEQNCSALIIDGDYRTTIDETKCRCRKRVSPEPAPARLREPEAPQSTPKEQHLMDVYDSLGIRWGDDPFPIIAALRASHEWRPETKTADDLARPR